MLTYIIVCYLLAGPLAFTLMKAMIDWKGLFLMALGAYILSPILIPIMIGIEYRDGKLDD